MAAINDLLYKKRLGGELTREEIHDFVQGVTSARFADYQISAMLMAIAINGMTERETVDLTMEMAASGDMLDLSPISGVKVDKHSTGGVGDTTSLVLVPLVAACGVKVAKMSGRGLGFTGGTLDKLESIPGLSVSMDTDRFMRTVDESGLAIIGQTASLAPCDKVLYALRDVTATEVVQPLIVISILSKQLASGADVIVLDVKTGSGAMMPTVEKAQNLAEAMVNI
ncbi:MAG: thymidine phosphorylase, partial [Clostridia bacterium]|nr:thymidine phosphorylase [Clostridia bacterium]